MPEESHSFAKTRVRLEEIVSQVRKKDTSLEKSLDLLEEGVRLANQCTELIDHADWEAALPAEGTEDDGPRGDSTDTDDSDAEGAAEVGRESTHAASNQPDEAVGQSDEETDSDESDVR